MSEPLVFSLEKKQEIYRDPSGARVPSVTTLQNLRSKPQLDAWKARLYKDGKDPRAEAAKAAIQGKLMHFFIEGIVTDRETSVPKDVLSDDEADAIGFSEIQALTGQFEHLWNEILWKGGKLVDSEKVLIDTENRFGGTIDLLVKMPNGETWIWDIKTGKDFYHDNRLQVGGGYTLLAKANNINVQGAMIVLMPKALSDDGSVKQMRLQRINHIPALQEEFMSLLCLYHASRLAEKRELDHPSETIAYEPESAEAGEVERRAVEDLKLKFPFGQVC